MNMKLFIFVVVFIPVFEAGIIKNFNWQESLEEDFKNWKSQFDKSYFSDEEELLRKSIWKMNLQNILKHNVEHDYGIHSYRLRMNHFGDLNTSEFRNVMNGFDNKRRIKQLSMSNAIYLPPLNVDKSQIPAHVDWRERGYVTPVKNQGHCGSCWSFSATGALEGQHYRKTGKLAFLSEQNLIDCSTKEGNKGCNGGLMNQAFEYVKRQDGIDGEDYYGYEAKEGNCRYSGVFRAANDVGFVNIPSGDEQALKEAVSHIGPISVAVDASHRSFQFYHSGVYNEPRCSSDALDHGVLVVGYGTKDGDYWLVKNSWGHEWGDGGYIQMSRNKDNQCGIATAASYPIV